MQRVQAKNKRTRDEGDGTNQEAALGATTARWGYFRPLLPYRGLIRRPRTFMSKIRAWNSLTPCLRCDRRGRARHALFPPPPLRSPFHDAQVAKLPDFSWTSCLRDPVSAMARVYADVNARLGPQWYEYGAWRPSRPLGCRIFQGLWRNAVWEKMMSPAYAHREPKDVHPRIQPKLCENFALGDCLRFISDQKNSPRLSAYCIET